VGVDLAWLLHGAGSSVVGQKIFEEGDFSTMAIQKKSLIKTSKTTKKATVTSAPATNDGVSARKAARKSMPFSRKSFSWGVSN
jgi:hypothetical protein